MPKATVSQDHVRQDLKTLPGGFVVLRQLPYHEMLVRRDGAMKMSMEGGDSASKDSKIDISMLQTWTREYEFKNCIVEHNLEDNEGQLLDFNSPMALRILDPRIGTEIETYIDALNSPTEEELELFTKLATSSALGEAATQLDT